MSTVEWISDRRIKLKNIFPDDYEAVVEHMRKKSAPTVDIRVFNNESQLFLNEQETTDFLADYARLDDFDGEYTITLYTGLRDKHGKKIYGGDILFHGEEGDWLCASNLDIVEYGEGGFEAYYTYMGWTLRYSHNTDTSFGIDEARQYAVVGNVFENNDLLEIIIKGIK